MAMRVGRCRGADRGLLALRHRRMKSAARFWWSRREGARVSAGRSGACPVGLFVWLGGSFWRSSASYYEQHTPPSGRIYVVYRLSPSDSPGVSLAPFFLCNSIT
jgi:hypothetical protein